MWTIDLRHKSTLSNGQCWKVLSVLHVKWTESSHCVNFKLVIN